jgi:hypothetical protein
MATYIRLSVHVSLLALESEVMMCNHPPATASC